MTIQRIDVGPLMSKAVVHGDTVYLSGMVANKTLGGSVAEQTREILGMIDHYLAQAGTDKSKLLRTNIWLSDISTWAEMNSAWTQWIDPNNPPARATVEAQIANAQAKVEIMVVAAK
jgi:enamine deaminase RidA (YjgF/YER057c/UK114 family)